jgi:hypothetical protein
MLSFFFENPAQMLFFGGIALATWVLMRRLFIHRRREGKQPNLLKELAREEPAPQSVDAPAPYAKWEVRLHDLGREITARIDSKLSALQALTKLAHQAAERLEIAAAHAAEVETERYGSSTLDDIERRLHEFTFEIGQPAPSPAPKPQPLDPVESLRRVVKNLLESGLTAEEIAAQTEMPLGEVEFLASTLRKKERPAA